MLFQIETRFGFIWIHIDLYCSFNVITKERKWFIPLAIQCLVSCEIVTLVFGWTKQSFLVIPHSIPDSEGPNEAYMLNASIVALCSICSALCSVLVTKFWALGELIVLGILEKITSCWWFLITSIHGSNSYTAIAIYVENWALCLWSLGSGLDLQCNLYSRLVECKI